MLDALIAFLGRMWDHIEWFLGEGFKQLFNAIKSGWGVILLASGWIWTAVHFAGTVIGWLTFAVDHIVAPEYHLTTGPLATVFALCNTFCPLSEGFSMLAAYATLLTACFLYRLAKSFIPFLP